MSDFNSQQEIYAHLISGGSVQHTSGSISKFVGGTLFEVIDGQRVASYRAFTYYKDFKIYEEKKWYDHENLPLLCKAWEYDPAEYELIIITGTYDDGYTYYRDSHGNLWPNAIPATSSEVEQYIYKGEL